MIQRRGQGRPGPGGGAGVPGVLDAPADDRGKERGAVQPSGTAGLDGVATAVAAALGAAVGAAAARRLSAWLPQSAREPWERINHAGRPVTLLEGPVWITGALTGLVAARATVPHRRRGDGARGWAHVAGLLVAGGALGALDDLVGTASSKGLKGHLGALRRGQVTTGAIKVAGLAATGLASAFVADRTKRGCTADPSTSRRATVRPSQGVLGTLVGGGVVAGAANAVNLFDLRPGRALKVVVLSAAPLAVLGSAPAGAGLGASLVALGDDLAGTSMLGDTGANAAGALVGLALVEATGLRGRVVALACLAALTLASERVSFTQVIEAHDGLRRLDEWGRVRP